jgi:plasmid stabilization system protein ParE
MDNNNTIFKVAIAPAANDRMYDHFEFLAQVNETAAERLLDELIADIKSLEYMPHRNPVYSRPYIKSGKYRYMVSSGGRYRIVYQIGNSTVFVDDIQDCRQDENKSLLYPE